MKIFKCYSSKLAHKLIKAGFKMLDIEPNLRKPWLDVFLFEDTAQLRSIVNQYCNQDE